MMAFQIFIFYAILNFHIDFGVECCGVVSFRQHFCVVVSYRYHTTLLECLIVSSEAGAVIHALAFTTTFMINFFKRL